VQIVLLPNDGALSTASILYRILWEDFSNRMVFCHQTRPTSQSLSCTNFWC
jgi:methylthioribose-1-phosphate isomerase